MNSKVELEKFNDRVGDPVCQFEGKWYFYDETWSDRSGPFDTEQEAREELDRYCKECLGEERI